MEVESGIELLYLGENRREDLVRAERFLDKLPLKISLPQTVGERPKQVTLAMRVTSGDIVIRPVEGVVEYHDLQFLSASKYLVSFERTGHNENTLTSGSDPVLTIWEKKQSGLHLNLYGSPAKRV